MVSDWKDYRILQKLFWDSQKLWPDLKPAIPEYEAVAAHVRNDSDCGMLQMTPNAILFEEPSK
jgi:hypothetical protein